MTGAAVPAAAGITTPAPTPAQAAAILGKARLQIAPIVGTSVEAATPLTQRLAARAKESGITLAGSAGQGATHVLKGYFSTISEGKDTTVIYVWDVYDPAGTRLHRINGQQKAPTVSGAEGWAAVPPATMQAIADQTITQLTNWLAGRPRLILEHLRFSRNVETLQLLVDAIPDANRYALCWNCTGNQPASALKTFPLG